MISERSTGALSIVRTYWPTLIVLFGVLVAVQITNEFVNYDHTIFSLAFMAVMATALSIFLVFRVNEAYARWWEGRTLWGQIVNSSRSYGRQVTTLLSQPEAETLRKELVYRQIAWVNVLRTCLREEDDWEDGDFFVTEDERAALAAASNPANRLLQIQSAALVRARKAGWLSDIDLLMFDTTLARLHDAQGGCERIKNTPFPDRVAYFGRVAAWGLAVLIPLSVLDLVAGVDIIDVTVVPLMMLVYVLTERIGAELRNPFSNHSNDVPMRALCRTIEIDLRQQLGEKELPQPLEPVKGVLM